ncbi:VOC family protein [Spirosoma foliorum]|uniref:Glyoxalase/bleomycin resistance/dioxygenase family protein n=1 Tax=Spirosoma foliorum TaxID=2710596 RepID=A0A7G5H1K6_9BACT|nr:glyoxalase/bleomycin resistance/dioxygenase family protein [Spirosoma foliorum]QMW04998.1 glyoxalase/bleomycin resistance/dioxygenase family protein [Spirosoma foliorum]
MKILELDLYTNNLEAIRLFYVGRLGLPLLSRSVAHLTVLVGFTQLTFQLVDKPVAPYHVAINVPCDSLDVLMYYYDLDYLSTQEPGKTIAYFPDWRAKACYFYDPCGNLLEFIARTDLNLNDPNLTFSDLFQCVSEIGLPTQDVAYTAREIQRRFRVEQFCKTKPILDFNALGDDNGLFILAKLGRTWLFSNTQAGLTYCRVRFTTGADEAIHELYSFEVNQLPIGYAAGNYRTMPEPVKALVS